MDKSFCQATFNFTEEDDDDDDDGDGDDGDGDNDNDDDCGWSLNRRLQSWLLFNSCFEPRRPNKPRTKVPHRI